MTSPTSDRRQGLVGNTPIKAPVDVATTVNIALAGEQTIDGWVTSASRVLVHNQTDPTQNGIYDTSTANWTRSYDANGNYDLTTGTIVAVLGGATQTGFFYQLTTAKPITIGTSPLVWQQSLIASGSVISFLALGVGAQSRSIQDKGRDAVSAFDFMSAVQIADVRSFTYLVDVTATLQVAINITAALGIGLILPGGGYSVLPATSQAGAGTYNTALVMQSGMHLIGQHGATLRVANNYSTNGTPKELAIFSTVAYLQNVSFEGITFDLNGANNLMSPARPASYNQFNHAAIMVNGPTGYMDDVLIDKCTFKNTAGVCYVVCQLVAVATTPTLGKRWKITDNLFLNGGLDTNDHTSIYAWCEDVICEGNTFWEDSPPHTVGKTGGATCYEVHGSNQRFVNNYCYNYTLGAYVAPNFTNTTLNTIVSGNHFYCSDFGILIWRGVALGYKEIDGVLIQGNTFYFDNYTYAGQSTYKSAVAYQGQIATAQGAVSNIKISDNYALNVGNTLLAQFVRWDTSTTVSNTGSNLCVTDNQVIGFTDGFYLVTNSANGIGLVEVSRNQFIAFTPDSLANPPHGIYINATAGVGAVKTLVINDNQFIDERGSPQFNTAIYLAAGTITDLSLGSQTFKGMSAANFNNAGATITNSIGTAEQKGQTNVADGGTVTFNANFTGLTPRAVLVTGIVAGETVSVTAVGASSFTVAIKKWTGGVLTAGTTQQINWVVKF